MDYISKEAAIEIILWAEEQKHIKGDIETVIQAINEYKEGK